MTYLRTALVTAILLMLIMTSALAEQVKPVRIGYPQWYGDIATANLVKAVIEKRLGRRCSITPMPLHDIWSKVASGELDVMLSAWLPRTQDRYFKEYGSRLEDLGPNLIGASIGLVVPDVNVGRLPDESGERNEPYIPVYSIPDLAKYAERFGGRILGIEGDAGVMDKTREALKAYGIDNLRLVPSDERTMVHELSEAIQYQKWIVVTGWKPHWMFGVWKLRMLEDPKNIFGHNEAVHTLVRKGLKNDMPKVYDFLERFSWNMDEINTLMTWIELDNGVDPYGKALRWIETHPKRVDSWIYHAQ